MCAEKGGEKAGAGMIPEELMEEFGSDPLAFLSSDASDEDKSLFRQILRAAIQSGALPGY